MDQKEEEFEELRKKNLKETKERYKLMEKGIIEKTVAFELSKNIEASRTKFIEEGYIEYDEDDLNDFELDELKEFIGKKCRYILKSNLVRTGGRISSIGKEDDKDDIFIFIRPFSNNNSFRNGWSVQFNNIKYLYIADINRKQKLKKEKENKKLTKEQINANIFYLINNFENYNNKTNMKRLITKEHRNTYQITNRDIDEYFNSRKNDN